MGRQPRNVTASWWLAHLSFQPLKFEPLREFGVKYEVKFAVRDNLSGLPGTVSVPIELK